MSNVNSINDPRAHYTEIAGPVIWYRTVKLPTRSPSRKILLANDILKGV